MLFKCHLKRSRWLTENCDLTKCYLLDEPPICGIMRNRKNHYICPLDLYRISSIFYSMIDCDSQCGLWGIVYLFIHALLVACGKFVFSAMTWCCFSCEIWSAGHHGGCENCRRQKMLLAQLPPPARRRSSSGLQCNCTAVRQSTPSVWNLMANEVN